MTAQDLKNSILLLAIQGKLVEQRPEEGTAEELYRQIQAEKQALIKAGKIKKEKPLPQITEDEVPFDIPESWKWVRFTAVISLLSGADLMPDKYNALGNGIPYITGASNIESGTVIINRWTEYPNNVAHKGDLLLSCKGTVGKTIILSEDSVHIARQIMAITAFVADTKYIQFYVQSQVEHLKSKAKSMIPGIERNNVLQLPFPLPPLAEQKRIVAKIEELMPLVEKYGEAEERLTTLNAEFPDKLRKSILQQAIRGKLTERDPADEPASELLKRIRTEKEQLIKEGKIKKEKPLLPITEEEIPFEIPDNWKWVRLADLCKSITDGDHQPPPQVPQGIPFLVISNVSSGALDFSNTRCVPKDYFDSLPAERIPQKGDILFTVTGSYGIPVKVDRDMQFCFQRHMALLKPLLDWDFLLCVLKSPLVKTQCDTTATGTAQKTVGLTSLRNIIIPLPPQAEQQRIVDRVNELLAVCDELK